MTDLEVFSDLLERFQWGALAIVQRRDGVLQAVINVILDKRSLGLTHRFFHGMQLLSNVDALTTVFDHGNDAAQMTVGPLEALDNRLMGSVRMGMIVFTHDLSLRPDKYANIISPLGDTSKRISIMKTNRNANTQARKPREKEALNLMTMLIA